MKINQRAREIMWLQQALQINSAKINALDAQIGISDFLAGFHKYDDKLSTILGGVALERKLQISVPDFKPVDDVIFELERKGIGAITQRDPEYPENLKNIAVPPAIIYYKGDVGLLKTRCLAVVGTRNPSHEADKNSAWFTDVLSKCPLTIVSGMADGVDGIAHRTTLKNGGKTIAILGTGIDVIYPSFHASLYDRIAREGLVISEFYPGTPPRNYNFPERNRLISGLSEGVLVVEGGKKSGSLITAHCAIEQGKELFVIPSALGEAGAGGNELLKSCQGALVTSPDDIAEALGLSGIHMQKASAMQLDFTEEQVIRGLTVREMNFDELIEFTGLGVSDLNALLVRMELVGLIRKLDNNYYGV